MKFALPLTLLASPAFAHPGAHSHPHGVETWITLAALAMLVGLFVVRARR